MSQVTGTGSNPQRVWQKFVFLSVAIGLGGAALSAFIGGLLPSGPPNRVGPPDQDAAAATAAALARATQAQHLCYGWQLDSFERGQWLPLSLGSNAGAGVSVRQAPGCERWLVIAAQVSAGTRRNKVVLTVVDSHDESSVRLRIGALGMTEKTFLADTGAGVLRAAGALPLIAAEKGLAQPVPAQPAPAAVRPLPPVGSDLFRGRSGSVKVGIPLLFLALPGYVLLADALRRRRAGADD
ncbi:hypothetical protein AB0368_37045 [Actinoplanes sp. NPDC051475]|uniref:hypothetical protein n=1 Tax=Actinoplanes sp. NPDC051475 TaxID=3157225 RepID=UPI00344BA7F2